MNKTGQIIGWIVVIIVVAGLVYYGVTYKNQSTATQTPVSTTVNQTSTAPSTNTVAGTPTEPAALTNANAVPSDTTASVTGTVTPNGALSSYWYAYGATPSLGQQTSNQAIGSGYNAIPAPGYITGLTTNTTYYYQLVAVNQYGKVNGQEYSFQTTVGNPPPGGSAPRISGESASGISSNTANLNGTVTPNNESTTYWFEYGTTTDLGNITPFVSAGSGTSGVPISASLSNLDSGTTYYFRLDAQNQFGTTTGSIISFTTAGPPSPAAPSATTRSAVSINASAATLRGTINPNGADTTYWFEYSTDSLLSSVLLTTTAKQDAGAGTAATSVSADISGLASGTKYYFRAVAQNSFGTVYGDLISFETR